MNKSKTSLKVALHAMDDRSTKLMKMYLQGPCAGIAVVVGDRDAECDIFDADSAGAKKLLDSRLTTKSHRPIIALSLQDQTSGDVLYIKKPVKIEEMLAALEKARALVHASMPAPAAKASPISNKAAQPPQEVKKAPPATKTATPTAPEKPTTKKNIQDTDEQKKTSKHQAAMQLNEKSFGAFIGNVPGIDVNDPKHFAKATYNPKDYFQGYVESAFKVCEAKGQIRQLNVGWNPLIMFPHSHEIWFDVDDKQLRAFAGLALNNTLDIKITLTPLDPNSSALVKALDKFHTMDSFIWKLALWASKGRYPAALDINQPVYLKCWPNFTRLLVTPHAMRITALLMQGPRTLGNVAQVLNIKPQYVFVFISAAYALGIAGQAKRDADVLVHPAEIKPNKKQGLLSRIIQKLRGN